MSIPLIGGLLLILGAYLTYSGEIFKSVSVYICADICWCILAFQNEDYLGATFIIIGTLLGVLAFLKMQNGIMKKDLHT